ncbi:hypothetical protein [Streptomyces anulatus]|uniref:hypothetical protein n=1 Tax=Streptomyces anulatus TaxID=1892 RepID=UPI001C2688E7|nr:hypothetical protein [Streptomyces anulatus]
MGAFMDLRRGGWAQEVDAELGEADVHDYGPVRALPVPESLGFTFHGEWVDA